MKNKHTKFSIIHTIYIITTGLGFSLHLKQIEVKSFGNVESAEEL